MKLKQNSKVRVVGLSSFFALLALLGTAVFCPAPEGANAIERSTRLGIDFVLRQALDSKKLSVDFFLASGGGIDYETIAKQLGIDFVIAEKLSLEMSDPNPGTVTSSVQPTDKGKQVTGTSDFTVNTNSTGGLSVYIYNGNGTTGESAMVGTTTSNRIEATEGAANLAALALDTWGYNLSEAASATSASNLAYKGIATSKGGNADYTTKTNGAKNLRLTFAANISTATAPDTYSNTVKIHTVPNANATTLRAYFMSKVDEAADEAAREAGYESFADYQAQKALEENVEEVVE